MSDAERTLIRKLELPYESVRTMYEGDSEVRLYRNELTGDLQVGKRFAPLGIETSIAVVQEGALLRRIEHRHVTRVYEVARVTGYQQGMDVVEVIMPFYEGGSLYDAFNAGDRFSVGTAIKLCVGALHGLAEIHEVHGVLHRDIKSPNLLLDDGLLLVGDLGTAIEMDPDGSAEALPNARLYSPPESLTTRRVNRSSDLYQVGVVLHELLSGPLPYTDATYDLDRVAERLAKGRRPILPRHFAQAPWVSPRLRSVVTKATAVSPEARYPHVKAMVDALVRAPRIDWRQVADDVDHKRWEGTAMSSPGREFAVDAHQITSTARRRRSGWVLCGLQRVNAWQRALPDAIVPDLQGRQAATFFDSMVAIACSR